MKQILNIFMLLAIGHVGFVQASSVAALQTKIAADKAAVQTINANVMSYATWHDYAKAIVPAQNRVIQDLTTLVGMVLLNTVQLTAAQMKKTTAKPGGKPASLVVEPNSVQGPISTATAVGGIYVEVSNRQRTQTFSFNFDSSVIASMNTVDATIWTTGLYVATSMTQDNKGTWNVSVSLTDMNGNAYATGTQQTTIQLDVMNVFFNCSSVQAVSQANNSTAILNVPINHKVAYKSNNTTTPLNILPMQLDSSLIQPIATTVVATANKTVKSSTCINTNYPVSVANGLSSIAVGLTDVKGHWLVFQFDEAIFTMIKNYYPSLLTAGLYIATNVVQKGSTYVARVSLTDSNKNVVAYGQSVTPVNLTHMNISFNAPTTQSANPANNSTGLISVNIENTVLYQQQTTTSNVVAYNQPFSGQTISTSLSGSDALHKVVINLANNTSGPDITLTQAQVQALLNAASQGSFWVNTIYQNDTLYYNFLGASTNNVIVSGSAPFNGNQIQICCYQYNVTLTEPGYINPGKSVHITF